MAVPVCDPLRERSFAMVMEVFHIDKWWAKEIVENSRINRLALKRASKYVCLY